MRTAAGKKVTIIRGTDSMRWIKYGAGEVQLGAALLARLELHEEVAAERTRKVGAKGFGKALSCRV